MPSYHPLRNTLNTLIVLVAITAALIAYSIFGQAGGASGDVYEYRIEYFEDSSTEKSLNRLGAEGWKVVGSRRASGSYSSDYGYEFIFMRPL